MPHIRHSDPRTWTSSAASPAFRACCDHSSVFSESIIAPSLLACDFGNLALEAHRVMDAGADWLHVDVMDGHFVPNMAIGIPVIESLRSHTDAFFDCHMMVSDPDRWVDDMHRIGASQYTFHIEATETPRELIKKIRNRGMCPAVGIKPNTPVQSIMNLVDEVDMVLVMTVEPGFGGQAFMPDMMSKVKELRSQFPTLRIQVDGGINAETAKVAASAGANVLVAGSSLFKLGSLMQKKALIAEMRSYVQGAGQGSHC